VSAVIQDDQVILVTGGTQNRGGPEVTIYEVNGSNGSGRGGRKGQPNMPTKLTDMTQGIISTLRSGDD
jgi:hypothetical protein